MLEACLRCQTHEIQTALTATVGIRPRLPQRGCMPRRATVPSALQSRPFSTDEAHAAGISRRALQNRVWKRIGAELYCSRAWHVDPWEVLAAWHRRSPAITFSGKTAAWMHGLDCTPTEPVEALVAVTSPLRSCFGLALRRAELRPGDVTRLRALPVTALPRTLRDLCVQWTPVEALVAIDMAVKLGLTDGAELWRYARTTMGARGSPTLRELASLSAPAESPLETRFRWLFVRSGLPRPEVQKELRAKDGRFLARVDLYYGSARLVVEIDGANHRDRQVSDLRRQNQLVAAGFVILRFTSTDLRDRPEGVVADVRAALRSVPLAPEARNPARRVETLAPEAR